MSPLPHSASSVSSSVIAALLLLARPHLKRLGLAHPSSTAILKATQATKSRAYELMETLATVLPKLVQPMGRPKKAATPPASDPSRELSLKVLRFLYAHPGAATHTGGRRFYSDSFRHHILELRSCHSNLELEAFARAVGIPVGTLDGWLRHTHHTCDSEEPFNKGTEISEDASLHIQTILAAWRTWCGPFEAFVNHVNRHLRTPFGRSFIARILFTYNERIPRRRAGRSPDEEATRDTFEVFFPDAQWVGDGMQVPVVINGERFDFNLELNVDAYSGAWVGASIRDEEDSRAVVEAFEDGGVTTRNRPLALLLDNRSSNHTDEVDQTLGSTMRMRATLGRAQNKAHVEGAFGLFSQQGPPLDVNASTLRELAEELLRLHVQAFGRALNHRPRRDRNWQSRFELHRDNVPTLQQLEAARRALEDRNRKLERARENDLLRADPVITRFLDDSFERLGVDDPERHARRTLARYGRDVVVEAIAIFEGKKNAGTLPDNVDAARYILGIAKNLAHVHEADEITLALIRDRLALHDASLASLRKQRDQLLSQDDTPKATLYDLLDRVLHADRMIDRFFWIDATADFLMAQPRRLHSERFRELARRIHATFALRPSERFAIERRLARLIWRVV